MKNKKIMIAVVTLMIIMSTGVVYAVTQQPDGQRNTNAQGNGNSNASECVTSPEATEEQANQTVVTQPLTEVSSEALEDMLVAAIEDEYKAQAEYDALIDTFGAVKPLTNIIKAEANHIDALEALFEAYGFPIPEDNGVQFVVLPDTLDESFQTGVDAEIKNIAIYEDFLKQDLPQDVEDAFINLMNASENHLAAFERQLD
jgi:hypothetical protein